MTAQSAAGGGPQIRTCHRPNPPFPRPRHGTRGPIADRSAVSARSSTAASSPTWGAAPARRCAGGSFPPLPAAAHAPLRARGRTLRADLRCCASSPVPQVPRGRSSLPRAQAPGEGRGPGGAPRSHALLLEARSSTPSTMRGSDSSASGRRGCAAVAFCAPYSRGCATLSAPDPHAATAGAGALAVGQVVPELHTNTVPGPFPPRPHVALPSPADARRPPQR